MLTATTLELLNYYRVVNNLAELCLATLANSNGRKREELRSTKALLLLRAPPQQHRSRLRCSGAFVRRSERARNASVATCAG